MLLPVWLAAYYNRRQKQPGRRKQILQDVLWGQYCLFLFIRIQDDVFDGHVQSPSLIFTADQFLIEAQETFSKWFGSSSAFWNLFRNHLQESTLGVTDVDRLQQVPGANPERLLAAYARVNAIFKIGSAAVCLHSGRMRDFTHVEKFADEMAVGCQILDDLEDINEDLERNRFNYAASSILKGQPTKMKGVEFAQLVAKNLLLSSAGDELLTDVRRRFTRASSHLSGFRIAGVKRAIGAYEKALQQMQISLHRKRARIIFGKTRGGGFLS